MNEHVILVDEHDGEIGIMPKLEAHQKGVLHRAVSVFVFNSKNELLVQQRAMGKYHSAGLWSNTCCSHPRQGESPEDGAARRLYEEMRIYCHIEEAFSFIYKAELENDLTEYEYDHVFVGVSDDMPNPDAEEVAGWGYVSREMLDADIQAHPEKYTEWFKICVEGYGTELFNEKNV
jgi:isopentenyl-diphosphate delta-isomerase